MKRQSFFLALSIAILLLTSCASQGPYGSGGGNHGFRKCGNREVRRIRNSEIPRDTLVLPIQAGSDQHEPEARLEGDPEADM